MNEYLARLEERVRLQKEQMERELAEEKATLRGTPYVKIVSQHELNVYTIAAQNGIAPKILDVKKLDDEMFELSVVGYEESLSDVLRRGSYIEYNRCLEIARILLTKLHSLGILHGDISEDNIVYNGNDVRLIDFGMSYRMEDITNVHSIAIDNDNEDNYIKFYEDLYYEGVKYVSESDSLLDYVKQLEHGCITALIHK